MTEPEQSTSPQPPRSEVSISQKAGYQGDHTQRRIFCRSGVISARARLTIAHGLASLRAPYETLVKRLHDESHEPKWEDVDGLLRAVERLLCVTE